MGKKLCKAEDSTGVLKEKKSRYYCKSCGAEAVKEKHLCKPKHK
jgi:hypothetical protein